MKHSRVYDLLEQLREKRHIDLNCEFAVEIKRLCKKYDITNEEIENNLLLLSCFFLKHYRSLQEHFTKDHYTPLEEIERSDISHFLNQLGWDITKISKIKIWYKSKHESKSKPIEIKTQEHLGIFTEFLSKLKQSDIFNEGATIENNDKTPGRKKDFRVTVLSGFCFDLYCLLEDYAKRSKNEKFYKSKGTISNRAIHLFIVKILYEMDLLTDDEKRSYEAKSQVEKENSLADFVRKKIQAYQENDLDKDSDPNDPAIGIL